MPKAVEVRVCLVCKTPVAAGEGCRKSPGHPVSVQLVSGRSHESERHAARRGRGGTRLDVYLPARAAADLTWLHAHERRSKPQIVEQALCALREREEMEERMLAALERAADGE